MNFLIKCVGIALIIFNLQPAIAADNTNKKAVSDNKDSTIKHDSAIKHDSTIEKESLNKKGLLDISVTNAFIYVPLGASKTTTGFFTIANRSGSDISIIGVSSSFSKQIKLMPKAIWVVPAHESLALNPKGYFLQINDLKTKLTTGDELHLTISLSNGQKLQIIASAKSAYDQRHGH